MVPGPCRVGSGGRSGPGMGREPRLRPSCSSLAEGQVVPDFLDAICLCPKRNARNAKAPLEPRFFGASGVLLYGGEIWIGTLRDREDTTDYESVSFYLHCYSTHTGEHH